MMMSIDSRRGFLLNQRCWMTLSLFIVLGCPRGAVKAADPANVDELRSQLRTGWEQLQRFDEQRKTYEVILEKMELTPEKGRQESTSRAGVRVDWANRYRLVVTIKGETPNRGVVYGRNPFYAFLASREGNEWRLAGTDKSEPEQNSIDQSFRESPEPNGYMLWPLSYFLWGKSLTDLLKDKSFHINSFNRTTDEKLSFRFSWKHLLPGPNKWLAYEGDMLVNPSLSYVAEELNFSISIDGAAGSPNTKVRRSVNWEGKDSEMLLCQSLTTDALPYRKHMVTFENYQTNSFPLEPFRLGYYGLPEPVDVPPPPASASRFVWITILAFSVIGAALIIWWGSKRSRFHVRNA